MYGSELDADHPVSAHSSPSHVRSSSIWQSAMFCDRMLYHRAVYYLFPVTESRLLNDKASLYVCVGWKQLRGMVVLLQEGGPLPGPKTGLLSNTWK